MAIQIYEMGHIAASQKVHNSACTTFLSSTGIIQTLLI